MDLLQPSRESKSFSVIRWLSSTVCWHGWTVGSAWICHIQRTKPKPDFRIWIHKAETKAFLWVWARPMMIQRMVSERLYFRFWPISIVSWIMIILLFSRSNQTSVNHQSITLTVNDHGIYYNNRITFKRSFTTRQHALGNHSSIAFRNISRPRVETRSFGRFVGHDSGIGLFIETRTH